MKALLKIVTISLLLFNGIGAVYGGVNLMLHPDGSSIQLSEEWLKTTPFHNYFIPGVILFIANGLGSFIAFSFVLIRHRNDAWLVMAQGAILTGWIIIQILLIQTVYFLHFIMGGVGIALILLGWVQYKINPAK